MFEPQAGHVNGGFFEKVVLHANALAAATVSTAALHRVGANCV